MKFIAIFFLLLTLQVNAQEHINSTKFPDFINPSSVTFHSSFIAEDVQASIVASSIGGTHDMQKIYANIRTPSQSTQTFNYNLVGNIISSKITVYKDRVIIKVRTDVGKYNPDFSHFEIGQTIYKLVIDKNKDGYKNPATLNKEYR